MFFNSSNVSKADSESPLTQLDPEDKNDTIPSADPAIFNRWVTVAFRVAEAKSANNIMVV